MKRRRAAAGAARTVAALAVVAGCASQTVWIAPPIAVTPGPVNGLLLDGRNRPLPGQIVAIGAEKTTSDGEGRFGFATAVPVNYDLVIARPDGALATVYQGLTRRDPIVVFAGAEREPAHQASIAVTLAGGEAARGPWRIYFVSARASEAPTATPARSAMSARDKAVTPEPLVVQWDGGDTVSGVVIALSMREERFTIPLALFAQQAVTLRARQAATVTLRPAKVPVVRRPPPIVQVPKEDPGFDPTYIEEYRQPGVGFATHGRPAQVPYDIPDLTGFGLQLCAHGFQWNPYLHSDRVQCGVAPGKLTTVVLPSPPVFKSPAWDTHATPGMTFTWTPVESAVYRLSLVSQADKASADQPRVEIVTARPEAAWPDLSAVGVGFPKALAAYAAEVYALGPFASMDDLVSPQGLGDPTPRDRWRAGSKELSIPVEPALGKEEAACVFKETVFCGTKPMEEYYRLSVINRKIRRYPDFAAAARLHCVRDCEGARTYTKVYREYSEAHPGFDQNEPLNMLHEREPEPPPEMFKGRPRAWSGGR
jgi:hypothetical protein